MMLHFVRFYQNIFDCYNVVFFIFSVHRYPSCSGAKAPGLAADMRFRDSVIAFIGPACAFALEPVARLAAYWNLPIITGMGDQVNKRNSIVFFCVTHSNLVAFKWGDSLDRQFIKFAPERNLYKLFSICFQFEIGADIARQSRQRECMFAIASKVINQCIHSLTLDQSEIHLRRKDFQPHRTQSNTYLRTRIHIELYKQIVNNSYLCKYFGTWWIFILWC